MAVREAFRQWVGRQGWSENTKSNQRSQLARLEATYGELVPIAEYVRLK